MSNKSKSNTGGAFGNGPKRHRKPRKKPSLPGARLKKKTTEGMPYHEAVVKERESQ